MTREEMIDRVMGEFAAIDKCTNEREQARSEAAETIIREALTRMSVSDCWEEWTF